MALYLNSFVLVVQLFLKVPAGSGPVFALAHAVVLLFYLIVGFIAVKRFHPTPALVLAL